MVREEDSTAANLALKIARLSMFLDVEFKDKDILLVDVLNMTYGESSGIRFSDLCWTK